MGTLPHIVLCCALALPCASAQTFTVLPPIAATLPGNAAVSLPLRWSQGTLQLALDAQMLAPLQGRTLTGIRMRRPSFVGEPPYAAVQRTIGVRAGFTALLPQNLSSVRSSNWPPASPGGPPPASDPLPYVVPPAAFAVAANAPPAAPQVLGAETIALPFATPLPVAAGTLLLEFEVTSAAFAVDGQWLDAAWTPGADTGYAAQVGDGACTTLAGPLQLQWTGASGPTRGTAASLLLTGAPPNALAFAWLGLDPQAHATGPGFLGFGASLGAISPALAPCNQWVPIDGQWSGTTTAGGGLAITFALPLAVTAADQRLGVQTAVLDVARPGLPIDVSNGAVLVLDRAGIGPRCATVFFPGAATQSPWPPYVGLMPVLVVES